MDVRAHSPVVAVGSICLLIVVAPEILATTLPFLLATAISAVRKSSWSDCSVLYTRTDTRQARHQAAYTLETDQGATNRDEWATQLW